VSTRIVLAVLRDFDASQGVAQDVFLAAWRDLPKLGSGFSSPTTGTSIGGDRMTLIRKFCIALIVVTLIGSTAYADEVVDHSS
jgi:hypothetical protein